MPQFGAFQSGPPTRLLPDAYDLEEVSRLHAQLAQSRAILDMRIKQAVAEVDRELALPPLPFDPEAERDRMLASLTDSAGAIPFTGIATPRVTREKRRRFVQSARVDAEDAPSLKAETVDSKNTRKALGLLTIGKSLLASGKSDKAVDRLRRILDDYPRTAAAATARKLLEDLK